MRRNKALVTPELPLKDDPAIGRVTLGLLHAVENDASPTQRSLALRVGVALGLTNAYLKRAMQKGWIKVRQAPARRFAYYLTPQGFAEKSKLTRQYLSDSFHFFRRARTECSELMGIAAGRKWRRIAVFGSGELAEIATLAAGEHGIELVAVIDAERNETHFAGLPVARSLAEIGPVDAVLLTDLKEPQHSYDLLLRELTADRVLVPSFLHVTTSAAIVEERQAS